MNFETFSRRLRNFFLLILTDKKKIYSNLTQLKHLSGFCLMNLACRLRNMKFKHCSDASEEHDDNECRAHEGTQTLRGRWQIHVIYIQWRLESPFAANDDIASLVSSFRESSIILSSEAWKLVCLSSSETQQREIPWKMILKGFSRADGHALVCSKF